jgi:hypothetical protein
MHTRSFFRLRSNFWPHLRHVIAFMLASAMSRVPAAA